MNRYERYVRANPKAVRPVRLPREVKVFNDLEVGEVFLVESNPLYAFRKTSHSRCIAVQAFPSGRVLEKNEASEHHIDFHHPVRLR